MADSKTLREQRASVAAEIQRMAKDADKFTAEDNAKWETINKEYDKRSREIAIAERAEAIDKEQRSVAEIADRVGRENYNGRETAQRTEKITTEQRAEAFQAWALVQSGQDISNEQAELAKRCGINPRAQQLDVMLGGNYSQVKREARDMSTTSGYGGETIPTGFVPSFERALLKTSGMREVASILRTPTGNRMLWPTTNDTSNSGALVGEAASVTGGADVTTSNFTLDSYKYSSKIVLISAELLRDNAVNLTNVLGEIMGERIGRATNAAYTTGDGTNKPNGIITAATLGSTCALSATVDFDSVLSLVYSVGAAYRQNAAFMCNDQVALALRKLKDSNDQYLWQPSVQAGQPDRLMGYAVYPNSDMASTVTASAKVLAFGDFSYYKIRDVGGLRIRRLVERYADTDQEGFVAFFSTDADLLDAGTHPVKYMIMHS